MKTAKQAATEAKKAAARLKRQETRTATRKAAKHAANLKKGIAQELPFNAKRIDEQIQKAVAKGETQLTYDFDDTEIGNAVCFKIKKRLEAKGYVVITKYFSYTTNMGDFNAPCVIDVSGITMTVSWKGK